MFDEAYNKKLLDKIYSTNLTYVDKEALCMPWYKQIDCSDYISDIINTLNKSGSVTDLKNGKQKIFKLLEDNKNGKL